MGRIIQAWGEIKINNLNLELEKAVKERDEFKLKIEKWEESSKLKIEKKNELAWGEKYEFQNYELKCREIKINNLNLELEKAVKERDEFKLKIEK
ncbi:hypothetical protein Tco_0125708 [Tanacetum coccineum]